MSAKHPIVVITGSSGAGTTSVTRTFQHIFRREQINATIADVRGLILPDGGATVVASARGRRHDG